MPSSTAQPGGAFSRLKYFLALSRTPHGLLDMTMPVAVALLWLGSLPPAGVMLLALFTVFAGYTAIYAVNDLADYKTDRANFLDGQGDNEGYLDAVYARHPMAMGLVTMREGLVWAGCWGGAALIGAFILNPVCAWMLLAGCALEVAYCLLLKVSHLRALLNGVVKTLGSLAAVLAVDPAAPWWFLGLVFAALFCWEIGGQNIPADWFDLELDQRQGAKTLCVVLGLERAARVSLWALGASTALAALILAVSPAGIPVWLVLTATAVVAWLLPWQARRLVTDPSRDNASRLFNLASYFPVVLLTMVMVWFVVR